MHPWKIKKSFQTNPKKVFPENKEIPGNQPVLPFFPKGIIPKAQTG